jgi:hypothetical protein
MSTPNISAKTAKSKVRSRAISRKVGSERSESKLAHLKDLACSVQALMVREEKKEPVPRFRGSSAPSSLADPFLGYVSVDTAESKLLRNTLATLFSDGQYAFKLKTALNMSSSGTGIVNSVIAMSALSSTSEFVALASVFGEFFITQCDVVWEPVSMYNYPLTGTAATTVSSLPIGCSDLQHAQPAYTSMGAMTNNRRYAHHNTGRPFKYSWLNTESPSSTVMASQTAAAQGWVPSANGSAYSGFLQFLSQSAPPALPATQVLGTFAVCWHVLFRVRQ